jgi:hypothetical protein
VFFVTTVYDLWVFNEFVMICPLLVSVPIILVFVAVECLSYQYGGEFRAVTCHFVLILSWIKNSGVYFVTILR